MSADFLTVRERPILFSGAMVRAILEGRKTQTRRVVKCPDSDWPITSVVPGVCDDGRLACVGLDADRAIWEVISPYGNSGDKLWVRETWASSPFRNNVKPRDLVQGEKIEYRATYDNESHFVWRPSIYMPRWASRITLEIVRVRVERLNEISEADAKAEGIYKYKAQNGKGGYKFAPGEAEWDFAGSAYRDLWESINGPASWEKNPWVWVVEFKRRCA